ncbi:ATPase [Thermococcus sp.]|uniref:ATPase n=1 Tax=Thermococcus sp. TaxID=35749 RepID=UPI002638AD1A|nr:ATPase [Thermococcus sp.]
MRIIQRRIELKALEGQGWKMLYGRRKTGKTFLVQNFLDYDEFFFVGRDGVVYDRTNGGTMTSAEFINLFPRFLKSGRVVVDEFHRLPSRFLDVLHAYSGRGELILVTSTLWLSRRVLLSKESPLLGIVTPVRVGLIDEREILVELSRELGGRELVEASAYLREPLLIQPYRPSLREFLTDYLFSAGLMIRELIGETFTEEEKELTAVYEVIMKGIADRKRTSTELSSLLYSRGLIEKDNPGVLQRYLLILTDMGILRKLPVTGKRRRKFSYQHSSPLLDLHFYLEEKYAYTELETPREFIARAVNEKVPKAVEGFVESLLSKVYGLRPVRIEKPKLELDIALQGFNRLELVGEVKWKKRVKREEVRRLEDRLGKFKCRRVLIVPSEDVLEKKPEDIEVLTPEELLELARESLKNMERK